MENLLVIDPSYWHYAVWWLQINIKWSIETHPTLELHWSILLSGAALGITDKMEAWPWTTLLILQAWSQDEGVRPCNSDLSFPLLGWVDWKGILRCLIVLERSMRMHKAFCSCAQRIIHKVNHWPLFKDFYKRVFQDEHIGRSLRPWEVLLSEAYLWGECLWQRSLLNLGLRNN